MERSQLPLIAPQYEPRYISANDVLGLINRGNVAGVNYDDPRIQEIRECILGNVGRTDFNQALREGWLNVPFHNSSLDQYSDAVQTAWAWWCTAAGHPHIVVSSDRNHNWRTLRCNLLSAGKTWRPTDFPHFERILGEVAVYDRVDYEVSLDLRVFEITGLDGDDAVVIARNLVDYTTTGTFRQRERDPLPEPDPHRILMKPLIPIERSDGG